MDDFVRRRPVHQPPGKVEHESFAIEERLETYGTIVRYLEESV